MKRKNFLPTKGKKKENELWRHATHRQCYNVTAYFTHHRSVCVCVLAVDRLVLSGVVLLDMTDYSVSTQQLLESGTLLCLLTAMSAYFHINWFDTLRQCPWIEWADDADAAHSNMECGKSKDRDSNTLWVTLTLTFINWVNRGKAQWQSRFDL